MKIRELKSNIDNFLNYSLMTDFEHFLDVYYNIKTMKMNFNLNSTIYFDIDDYDCLYTTVLSDLHWTIISYNLYNTTRLAWILMKLNNVAIENVFNKVLAGTVIKYIPFNSIQEIIKSYY